MQNENRSLSIVGCGWFGLPLAKEMLAGGWEVKGSTTSEAKLEQLYAMGIKPYLAQFPSKDDIGTELFDSAFLLINLPPGRRNPDVADTYPEAISQVVQTATRLGRTRKIVFVSSTSVYGHHHDLDYIDEATELMPETNAGKALWQAEQVVARCGIPAIILRFGGLAGPGRHPGNFFAGKSGLDNGHQAVNFLHLHDAIGVVVYMLETKVHHEVFNVVAPHHPSKKDFYTKMAKDAGLALPQFNDSAGGRKREISVDKLLKSTAYTFKYPDPNLFEF